MDESRTKRIDEFIGDLDEEELYYVNRSAVERLKLISQAKSTFKMAKFNIGQLVEFDDDSGNTITGRIIKLNKKTISILTDDNQRWNVSPMFLRKTTE